MTLALGKKCLWLIPRLIVAWLIYLVVAEFLLSLGAGEGFGRQLISLGQTGFLAGAPNAVESQGHGSLAVMSTVALSLPMTDVQSTSTSFWQVSSVMPASTGMTIS